MERVWTSVWLLINVQSRQTNLVSAMSSFMAERDAGAVIYSTEKVNAEKYELKEPNNAKAESVSKCRPNSIGRYIVRAFGNYTDDLEKNEKRKQYPLLEKYNVCQHNKTDDDKLVYISPEKIWGKGYTANATKDVCEACIMARGNDAEIIRFTKRGMNTCSKLCGKMDVNILRVWPTSVALKDFYCTKKLTRSAKCVCVFKISCRERNNYMFISLMPNRSGGIAVLYYEVENQ